ncbi:hypothetical protein GCM10011511_15130 [Puia dinghuensis]|uniref:Uncharacterized protein n=1 Tax=Puia dinghuensis TaxID=1792502 RepID=A0A8J2UB58_9BACT|nr:hypothetical protein GCM10011511_15130 [Puia dinghuensis]
MGKALPAPVVIDNGVVIKRPDGEAGMPETKKRLVHIREIAQYMAAGPSGSDDVDGNGVDRLCDAAVKVVDDFFGFFTP